MIGNPEIPRWRRALAPMLAMSIGGIASWGMIVGLERMNARAAVVQQYIENDGCLAHGAYDDSDGPRDNIEVKGVGVRGPTIIDVKPDIQDMPVLHLQYIGDENGKQVLGPADFQTGGTLALKHCALPDGM